MYIYIYIFRYIHTYTCIHIECTLCGFPFLLLISNHLSLSLSLSLFSLFFSFFLSLLSFPVSFSVSRWTGNYWRGWFVTHTLHDTHTLIKGCSMWSHSNYWRG